MAVAKARPPAAAAATHPGRERELNEDRVLADPERGIYAVVDGVGGESAGEVAAETAVEVLRSRLSRRTTDARRLVREAIALANNQIFERAQADPMLAGMACVLTVALVDGDRATVGHVGDSRLYVLRRGQIRKITRDHSPVGEREDAGELSEAEAMSHPRRNEIYRDVGSAPHGPDDPDFVDVFELPFDAETALLLCSDGLSDMVPAAEILGVVTAHAGDPDAAVQALVERANFHGGKDNVSAVLVAGARFREGARGRGRRAGLPDGASPSPRSPVVPMPAAQAGPGPERRVPPVRGAARVKPPAAARWAETLGGRRTLLLVLLAALLAGAVFFAGPLRRLVAGLLDDLQPGPPEAAVLTVGAGAGAPATIAEALARARPGQTVEVPPGEYAERIELPAGVSLVSPMPRAAVLRPPAGDAPAVAARGVRGARLSGFRIVGGAVGLLLLDSEVAVERVEVTGATAAGIQIAGTDRSALSYCYVHENPGAGVLIAGAAAPTLRNNLIAANGKRITANGAAPAAPRAGVEVRDGARPALVENRIEGNGPPGGAQVLLADPARIDEVFRWNLFGSLPRERAVRAAAAQAPGAGGNR